MKIHIWGSCSGTEPMEGRHHTSWTLETTEGLFWFDAGESCSYTAHLSGLDLLQTKAIFISHPHMDHVGGLPNLLWTLGKLRAVRRVKAPLQLSIYTPNPTQIQAAFTFLSPTESPFTSPVMQVKEGVLLEEPLLVEALPNQHLGVDGNNSPQSFSYRITKEGKKIVYSGDLASIKELDAWTNACDLLLVENAHHTPQEIASFLAEKKAKIGKLVFMHHSRNTMKDPEKVAAECRALLSCPLDVAFDGMVIEL